MKSVTFLIEQEHAEVVWIERFADDLCNLFD